MNMSRKRGATLGLVAALTLVITLLGIAFFFFARLVGGHRELEHATDSGNLNVAKQSVRSPRLNVFDTPNFHGPFDIADPTILAGVQRNFSELADPSNGQIDLLVYDRLVAQSFIVALNAAADNGGVNPSPLGISRAQQLIALLDDPDNGVGVTLARKLKGDAALDQNFTALAVANSVRMLKPQEATQSVAAVKDISFMVRDKASNVILDPNVLPPPFNQANLASDFVLKNGKPYFIGYSPLAVPNVTDNPDHTIMAVPLRPGEEPHLVDNTSFHDLQTSPLVGPDGNVHTRIPPNAFMSGGLASDARTLLAQSAISCAIAGSLNATFTVRMLNGFIAVVNGPGAEPGPNPGAIGISGGTTCINTTVSNGFAMDGYSNALMAGVWYVNAPGALDNLAVSTDQNCIPFIQKAQYDHIQQYGTPLHDAELASAAACLGGQSLTDKIQDASHIPPRQGANVGNTDQHGQCDNKNSFPEGAMLGITPDPVCENDLLKAQHAYGLPSNGGGTSLCLSALEALEATVMTARGSDGQISIGFPNPYNTCTGINAYPLGYSNGTRSTGDPNVFSNATIPTTPPTINQLIGGNGTFIKYAGSGVPGAAVASVNAQKDYNGVIQRLLQMKPTASMGEIQALFNQNIPPGSVKYIWVDNTDQNNPVFRFTDQAGLPSRLDPSHVVIDGTGIDAQTGPLPLISDSGGDNGYINTNDDGGYPHPFDCAPFGQGTSNTHARFTPSSGVDGILGVLRFFNCVNTGGGMDFSCPC